jgi:steroid delta-isomerase-like uncharacterized protein
MTRDEIVSLLDSRFTALNNRDLTTLMTVHDPKGVVDSPLGGHASGAEAIRKVYDAWLASFPDAQFEVEPAIVDGERVAQVATVTGTDSGGFMGLPPTGKKFSMPMVFLFTMRDGKILHERRIYDFTGLMIQLGVLKAKPA